MRLLSEEPGRGKAREDLKVNYLSDFVGSNTIYYRVKGKQVEIIDVLHQSMDPSRHIIH